LAVVALAFVANCLTAPPAEAHDALAESNPAQGQTVTEKLDQIVLTFNEAPLSGLQGGIVIQAVGPTGREATTGELRIQDRTLSRTVLMTEQGDYTVSWRTVSADGHPIDGSYTFSYAGPIPASPTATSTPTPSAAPTTSAVASPTSTPTAANTSSGAPIAFVVVIIIVVLLLAGGGLWLATELNRRRTTKP
jgi:methionine-rich copper-binding protein CopC